jgi:hypothetical protein
VCVKLPQVVSVSGHRVAQITVLLLVSAIESPSSNVVPSKCKFDSSSSLKRESPTASLLPLRTDALNYERLRQISDTMMIVHRTLKLMMEKSSDAIVVQPEGVDGYGRAGFGRAGMNL